MEDVSEFLRARGVQEETILQMEEQKPGRKQIILKFCSKARPVAVDVPRSGGGMLDAIVPTAHSPRSTSYTPAHAHDTSHQHISRALLFLSKKDKNVSEEHVGQDRLVNLATISIDSVVVEDLKAAGKFYDIVIDHLATMKDRRMAFLFK
ncbi:hypothetical protein F7725_027006 [Dissostichus mawsoni]|uniref:Uncharacterized protein n=1 Tax=Dissostichus mawsoni TaxID=36200 RepID=A0A7J5X8W2_DISMA|nr:hypothetical protein F7725_027006 [Dissostichus mawsoni]